MKADLCRVELAAYTRTRLRSGMIANDGGACTTYRVQRGGGHTPACRPISVKHRNGVNTPACHLHLPNYAVHFMEDNRICSRREICEFMLRRQMYRPTTV